MLTITQLEYIIAVNDTKNFSRAAQNCNVSQPSLSAQIIKAEELLDIIIFEKCKIRAIIFKSWSLFSIILKYNLAIEQLGMGSNCHYWVNFNVNYFQLRRMSWRKVSQNLKNKLRKRQRILKFYFYFILQQITHFI